MIYATKEEAKSTDEVLLNTTFEKFQCVSCRLSTSSQFLAAMHLDELKNLKARHENSCEIPLKDKVIYQEKEYELETLIPKVEDSST